MAGEEADRAEADQPLTVSPRFAKITPVVFSFLPIGRQIIVIVHDIPKSAEGVLSHSIASSAFGAKNGEIDFPSNFAVI
jgi:hypothetical protein